MEKEKIIAEVIVDLYEMRISTMNKYQEKYERVQDMFKYSFFTSAIAQIYDKYKIPQEVIEEVMRERSFKKSLTK
jgi:hypothetical protein